MIVEDAYWKQIMEERAKLIEVLKAVRECSGHYWDDVIPRYNLPKAIEACADIETETK